MIHRVSVPYKKGKFDLLTKIESRVIKIHISNALVATIWISSLDDKNEYVSWLIIAYVIMINGLFLIWWLQNNFEFLRGKILILILIFRLSFNKILRRFSNPGKKKCYKVKRKFFRDKKFREVDYGPLKFTEKIYKLKILNSLLIERIKWLEIDESRMNSIGQEEKFDCTSNQNQSFPSDNIPKRNKDDNQNLEYETPIKLFSSKNIQKSQFKTSTDEFILLEKSPLGGKFSNSFLLFKYKLSKKCTFPKYSLFIGNPILITHSYNF